MELLQAGVDCSVIALWLGHESIETTQTYLHAHLALKEAALTKLKPYERGKPTDGRTLVPAGIEEWLRRGPNKRMPTKQESKMPSDQIP